MNARLTVVLLTFAIMFLIIAAAVHSQVIYIGWEQFKKSTAGTSRANIGPANVYVKWIYDTRETIRSSPVVSGKTGLVYMKTDKYLYAINTANGSLAWKAPSSGNPLSGSIMSTPLIYSDSIYFGDHSGLLYGNAGTGNGIHVNNLLISSTIITSPTISYEKVDTGGGNYVSKNVIYVGTAGGTVRAINPDTGMQYWATKIGTDSILSSPKISNHRLYIGSDNGTIYSLNASDGSVHWGKNAPQNPSMGVFSTPAIDDKVYIGSNGGSVIALNTANGNKAWSKDSGSLGGTNSSPAVSGSYIVIGRGIGSMGKVEAYNKAGTLQWSFPTGVTVSSSPSISSDGKVYIGAENGTVYALNLTNGNEIWGYDLDGTIKWVSPAIINNVIFIATNEGKVYSLASDSTSPQYHDYSISDTAPNYGDIVSISIRWTDDYRLDRAVLQTFTTVGGAVPTPIPYMDDITINMTGNEDWSNFSWPIDQSVDETTYWRIMGHDTFENTNISASGSFKPTIAPDNENPVLSGVTQMPSNMILGQSIVLAAHATDNKLLKEAVLETNETGNATNATAYGSPMNLTGNESDISFTWDNQAGLPLNSLVTWRIYVSDISDNVAASDKASFRIVEEAAEGATETGAVEGTITDTKAPTYSNIIQSKNEVDLAEEIIVSVLWEDDVGLSSAVLETNATGKMLNTSVSLDGRQGVSDFSIKPTIGGHIAWRVHAFDQAGNSAATPFKLIKVGKLECLPPAPEPTEWSVCEDDEQTRTTYYCDFTTGNYVSKQEARDCEVIVLPVELIIAGVLLIVAGVIGFAYLRRKKIEVFKKSRPPEPPPVPPDQRTW